MIIPLAEPPAAVARRRWPSPIDEAAYHGLAGEFVAMVEPETEADPVALLAHFLLAFGSALNRAPFFEVGGDKHHTNLFAVLVGSTSTGRKGTAWGVVRCLFELVDQGWTETRVLSGMSSGEGLIWAIRDPISKSQPIKERGRIVSYQDEIVDQGVSDKRLFVVEPEFARVLKVTNREGNTLSALIRLAWDGQKLMSLTKSSPGTATDPHVSIMAHITREELLRSLDEIEALNGFGNRFLWFCVRRSKLLPHGGLLPVEALSALAKEVHLRLDHGRRMCGPVGCSGPALDSWANVYSELNREIPGVTGAMLARGAPITRRLALIYAILDGATEVRPEHLHAALAVWRYSEESVRHTFGDRLADPVADRILCELRSAPQGISRTEIRDLFKRHKKRPRIDQALELLADAGLARNEAVSTNGRPTEVWRATRSAT